jgi:hypothetical protein
MKNMVMLHTEEQSVTDPGCSEHFSIVVARYINSFYMQEIHVPSSCQQKESLQFNTDSKP